MDRIEFYHEDNQMPFCSGDSSFQPADGDLVNIRKKTYEVIGRSFTVDKSNEVEQQIRCNVILKEVKK